MGDLRALEGVLLDDFIFINLHFSCAIWNEDACQSSISPEQSNQIVLLLQMNNIA